MGGASSRRAHGLTKRGRTALGFSGGEDQHSSYRRAPPRCRPGGRKMPLPPEVRSYHTVWVTAPGHRPTPVRFAMGDDEIVVFGDGELADVPAGTRVSATVHTIAGGPPVSTF